ncbi:MAG: helix-turn-helix domain-containing protein [Labilibaculum sp.]|nr:helix-turn-helix domain-containing protein [Labilibaculum sp.]MBI9056962.1 helix-turn-helix domain-containing protein [Labilibaculum sp.]
MDKVIVISPTELQQFIEGAISKVFTKESMKLSLSQDFNKKKILLLKDAALYLQLPTPTFRQYLAEHKIKGAKIGKSWRFLIEDLDDFILKHRIKTVSEIEKEIDDELSK